MPFVCLISIITILAGCTSYNGDKTDPSIAWQKRTDYERMLLADPSTGSIPDNIRHMEQVFLARLRENLTSKIHDHAQGVVATNVRGPRNVGGRTRAFAIDVTNSNNLVAAGVSGGVWLSEDAGATWQRATTTEQQHSVTSITQDIRLGKTNRWYFSTGEIWGNSAQIAGNGVYVSDDGAHTWRPLAATISANDVTGGAFGYTWRIATDPASDSDVVYVAVSRYGIYRTADGGTTWTNVLPSTSLFSDVLCDGLGNVFATLSSFTGVTGSTAQRYGIFHSTDGIQWTNISPADLPPNINRMIIGISPSDRSQLWFLAETPDNGTVGRFHLRDGTREEWHSMWKYNHALEGGPWTNLSHNIPLFGSRAGDFFSQGGYDLVAAVSPYDTNLVVIGGTNLYRSKDGFSTPGQSSWIGGYSPSTPTDRFPLYPNHHPDQHVVAFHPESPNAMYSVNDAGVFLSDDLNATSVQWKSLNNGYRTTQFYTVAISRKKSDLRIIGGMQDNGTYMSNGTSADEGWIKRNGGDGSHCHVVDSRDELIVSSQSGRVRRVILDQQGNEVKRTRIDPVGASDYLFINPFVVDPHDERRIYIAGGYIMWRNLDYTQIPLGHDDSVSIGWDSLEQTRTPGRITAVAMDNGSVDLLYYGTQQGRLFVIANASTTASVTELTSGVFPKSSIINGIYVDPANSEHMVITFSNYRVQSIFATMDGGKTWQPVGGTLEEYPDGSGNGPAVLHTIITRYQGRPLYFAGTTSGLYMAAELNGESTVWIPVAKDVIGIVPVFRLAERMEDNLIVAATHGTGVYSLTPAELPGSPEAASLAMPPDGSLGITADTTLSWQPASGAHTYELQLSRDSEFTTPLLFGGIATTSFTVRQLEQGLKTYYWRVRAIGAGGRGPFSSVWTFRTRVGSPDPLLPPTATKDLTNPVLLVWKAVEGATSYHVQCATTFSFQVPLVEVTHHTDTSYSFIATQSNQRYFWRVSARDADGEGGFSTRMNFTTGTITSVLTTQESQSQFNAEYDPASGSLRVQVSSAEAPYPMGYIISDLGGRIIQNGVLTKPGETIAMASPLKGTYLIRIEASKITLSTKFIVR